MLLCNRELSIEEASVVKTYKFKVIPKEEGFILAGSPIGSEVYETKIVTDECTKIIKELELLEEIQAVPMGNNLSRVQSSYCVLRLCYAQRLNYLLRTTPPYATREAAMMLDLSLFDAALKIADSKNYVQTEEEHLKLQ